MARSHYSGGLLNKGKQSAFILCAAIYALEIQGETEPTRKRVLTYIRVKKLVAYESIAADEWSDEKKVWLQFFSWCREDITTGGLLAFRGSFDTGIWRLSEGGRKNLETTIDLWANSGKSAEQIFSQLKESQHECILSLAAIELVLAIGKERKQSV